MRRSTILVVEDDGATLKLLRDVLLESGHAVVCASSISEGLSALMAGKPDVVVLDRGLPDGDGLKLCLDLKKDPVMKYIPVIMLTGRTLSEDKVLGLRFGADDYLTKPFEIEELLARVDALVRRTYGELSPVLSSGGLILDIKARTVVFEGAPLDLTRREFDLLRVLMERPDTVLDRAALLSAVWGQGPVNPKAVDVTVMNVRRKLGHAAEVIVAVRALGYKFSPAALRR